MLNFTLAAVDFPSFPLKGKWICLGGSKAKTKGFCNGCVGCFNPSAMSARVRSWHLPFRGDENGCGLIAHISQNRFTIFFRSGIIIALKLNF